MFDLTWCFINYKTKYLLTVVVVQDSKGNVLNIDVTENGIP